MANVPRDYQEEAIFSPVDYYQRGGTGNPLICMPTGTGKGLVIAELIRRIFQTWPDQRVLMLTHVKTLIQQNADKLIEQWPVAPLGIHSAGLNARETKLPIIFGGVQSVANTIKKALAKSDGSLLVAHHFGWFDLIIIDEAHLLSPDDDTSYQYVIAELKKINPRLKVIGLTATPFRMKQGMLTEGGIFTDICFDITDVNGFNRLIALGYLCPLIAKATASFIDTSSVGIVGGDFNQKQLEKATDTDELTFNIVREVITNGQDRNCWLYFASGIDNAEHVASVFQSQGVEAYAVHSKLETARNDALIKAFKAGDIKCLVNKDMLTTGFDHPPIDLIGMGRATMSPGLWVQMAGRGTRPAPWVNKTNCKLLDFAKNRARLGPINDPKKPNPKGKGTGDMPVRICPSCAAYNHAAARFCEACGHEFDFRTKLVETASTEEMITGDQPQIEYFNVSDVYYTRHEKKNREGVLISAPSLKVTYRCGLRAFTEWVLIEHSGLARHRAKQWFLQRFQGDPPSTVHEALQIVSFLRPPTQIRVHVNKQPYPEILGAEF